MASFLVTGGAGFIGSHIVRALVERGHRVRVLDDFSSGRLSNLEGLDIEVESASVVDAAACDRACRGVDGIFHEAAQVSVPRSIEAPRESYLVNVTGTLNLLESARAARVPRFVFAASSAAYGDTPTLPKVESMTPQPLSPYASGKLAAEEMLCVWGRAYGMRTVSLRYFNVFGPLQVDDSPYTGVIAIFAKALIEGRRARIFGDGEQTRDLTYVDDVVAANLLAMERDVPPGSVINVGGGGRISINTLYRAMAEFFDGAPSPEHVAARAGDVLHSQASLVRAKELLGYEPRTPWREGIARTVAWYRARALLGAR